MLDTNKSRQGKDYIFVNFEYRKRTETGRSLIWHLEKSLPHHKWRTLFSGTQKQCIDKARNMGYSLSHIIVSKSVG